MGMRDEFRVGLEAEFALVESGTFRPLWHSDIRFQELNRLLEMISVNDLGTEGLKLEPPHRKLMPYVVEGYHLPDPEMNPIDIMPKGVEIRTPLAGSIEASVALLSELFVRLKTALAAANYTPVPISFHPFESSFEGPQNKRRHDFWQWAMEAMVTYGPDINVHLPNRLMQSVDLGELERKVNYYGPAITALTLASPIADGRLWTVRGRVGKSIRTYHRSVLAPAIEIHPDQDNRLEFKLFDMPCRVKDFHVFLLLWLVLLLGTELKGRASRETRVYDLGRVARFGLEAEGASERAAEVLHYAPSVLVRHGFDPDPLDTFMQRLETRRVPADDIIEFYNRDASIPAVLRQFAFAPS